MIQAFVDAIVEDKEPPIDVYRALDYSVPGLCAHLSAERESSSWKYRTSAISEPFSAMRMSQLKVLRLV